MLAESRFVDFSNLIFSTRFALHAGASERVACWKAYAGQKRNVNQDKFPSIQQVLPPRNKFA